MVLRSEKQWDVVEALPDIGKRVCVFNIYISKFLLRTLHSSVVFDEVQKSLCTTPGVDIRVGIGVLIYVKSFSGLYFPNHLMDLVHI